MYILLCQNPFLPLSVRDNEHFKASADDVIPSTKSVYILKSLVGVKMLRQHPAPPAPFDAVAVDDIIHRHSPTD